MQRAPYASDPQRSRGRLIAEPQSPTRSDYQRDRDRIIHSTAFRRLAHKTQVFVPHEGDHFRTRLTHSIEVGQLARALARALSLDEDLAEAVALAHDLGHTPFGHTGEEVLNELMRQAGGFDHNAQTVRIVTSLERRYAAFDGLNLCAETLEGLVKHNGPLQTFEAEGEIAPPFLPSVFSDVAEACGFDLHRFCGAEAQAAALADDIAYNAHDLDDGLRAGLFTLTDCRDVPFLARLLDEIASAFPDLDANRSIHELARRLITRLVEDAIGESQHRLASCRSLDDVRNFGRSAIAFSQETEHIVRSIRNFLWLHMYRHPNLSRVRADAGQIVEDLFRHLRGNLDRLPPEWSERISREAGSNGDARRDRIVCDYIAGMTDRYAIAEHRLCFRHTPDLRYQTHRMQSSLPGL